MKRLKRVNRSRHITSKWAKTAVLTGSSELRAHIPETRKMSRSSLKSMLESHRMIYIKPSSGTFGIGVMRVELSGEGAERTYAYQAGTKQVRFKSFDKMYASILKLTRKRFYLAQKGIHLLKHRKRRFDIRVMAQKSPKKRWETTGIVGRLGAPKKVVTNIHNGGTVTPFERLLAGHTSTAEQRKLLARLRKLGVSVGKRINVKYPGIVEVGLDVALDKSLHPWILEVNTSPDPFIFRKLKDKRVFAKIFRYAKAYGKY